MANEAQLRIQLTFAKGGSSVVFDSLLIQSTVAGTKMIHNRQTVGTSEEAIVLGEVAPGGGWFICRNLDATNYVSIKPSTGAAVSAIVMPGEVAAFRWLSTVTAPFAQANTAPVDIEYTQLPA